MKGAFIIFISAGSNGGSVVLAVVSAMIRGYLFLVCLLVGLCVRVLHACVQSSVCSCVCVSLVGALHMCGACEYTV